MLVLFAMLFILGMVVLVAFSFIQGAIQNPHAGLYVAIVLGGMGASIWVGWQYGLIAGLSVAVVSFALSWAVDHVDLAAYSLNRQVEQARREQERHLTSAMTLEEIAQYIVANANLPTRYKFCDEGRVNLAAFIESRVFKEAGAFPLADHFMEASTESIHFLHGKSLRDTLKDTRIATLVITAEKRSHLLTIGALEGGSPQDIDRYSPPHEAFYDPNALIQSLHRRLANYERTQLEAQSAKVFPPVKQPVDDTAGQAAAAREQQSAEAARKLASRLAGKARPG